jgi:hypothetical protein
VRMVQGSVVWDESPQDGHGSLELRKAGV